MVDLEDWGNGKMGDWGIGEIGGLHDCMIE
jgi:hypothetical protein